MNWSDLIAFAESIQNDQQASEVSKRAAISRAYYAGFHFAKDGLAAKGISTVDPNLGRDTHTSVIKTLRNYDYALGSDLDTVREYRENADYAYATLSDLELANRLATSINTAKKIKLWSQSLANSVPPAGQRRTFIKP